MAAYHLRALQIPGTSHRFCQDRYRIYQDGDKHLLIAADGHGSPPYTRSGLGARFACAAAEAALKAPAANIRAAIKDRYDTMVEKHLAFHPLEDWELARLGQLPHRAAYGTTLLAAALESSRTTLYQLGDGEIYALGADGQLLPPLPDDEFCQGNLTSSLSNGRCFVLQHWRTIRYDTPVAAVLLLTDGCEGGMPQAAAGLAAPETLEQQLAAMLDKTRHGDDQTCLLAFDPEIVEKEGFRQQLASLLQALAEDAKCQKQALQHREELQQLSAYLALATRKANRLAQRNDPAFSEYMQSLKPSFDRYMQLQSLLN